MNEERDNLEMQEEDEIITLTYDDGTSEEFYNIAELDYEDKWYIYLQPVTGNGVAEDEVLVYEMAEDEAGEEMFVPVEDETLLEKLVDMLNSEIQE